MRYFVMDDNCKWIEVSEDVSRASLSHNRVSLSSDSFVNINVRHIRADSLAELSCIMQKTSLVNMCGV